MGILLKLLKHYSSIYSDKVKVEFRPLEYIEIKTDKPQIIKLNDEYAYECKLSGVLDFIRFNDSKNLIFENIDELNKMETGNSVSVLKVTYFKLLITLLYEISKYKYKGFFAKRKYKRFLDRFFLENVEVLIEVFKLVLQYNAMLKKKQEFIQNMNIFNSVFSDMTVGGISLRESIRVNPETGEKEFVR